MDHRSDESATFLHFVRTVFLRTKSRPTTSKDRRRCSEEFESKVRHDGLRVDQIELPILNCLLNNKTRLSTFVEKTKFESGWSFILLKQKSFWQNWTFVKLNAQWMVFIQRDHSCFVRYHIHSFEWSRRTLKYHFIFIQEGFKIWTLKRIT